MKKIILACMTLCCGLVLGEQKVKIIDLSWSNPTIEFLEQHLADMEKDTPLDGLTIRISGRELSANGKTYKPGNGNAWNKQPWTYEAFDSEIQRYKALQFTKFTDNFFYVTTSRVDFDWCNDEDWKAVAGNFGVAAKVSKAMGLKGLLVDIEEYGKKFWNYGDDVHPKNINRNELHKIAFKRGQQWGQAIFSEYPDIILFMPFALTARNSALAFPFMNGVLDVIPPTALIYEGHEAAGYHAKSPSEYPILLKDMYKIIRTDISPENRIKARGQIVLSPAFYLDAHWPKKQDFIYHKALQPEIDELGAVKFFIHNMLGAMDVADPYIWVYGETRCWWKDSKHPAVLGTWDEAPGAEGLTKAFLKIKDLEHFEASTEDSIVPDPFFKGEGNVWKFWQVEDEIKDKESPGTWEIKDGKATARNVTKGCFHQTIPIKPGVFYAFRVKGGVVNEGGFAGGALCFQGVNHNWLNLGSNLYIKFKKNAKDDVCCGIIHAPENAAFVSVQCSVSAQEENGEAYFTEVYLTEL